MDETDLVGQTISHDRITERLGGGGMVLREMLAWLDKYFGPVTPGG